MVGVGWDLFSPTSVDDGLDAFDFIGPALVVTSGGLISCMMRQVLRLDIEGMAQLALAIYNYGGSNVRRLIRSLPETPRERNFWQLLTRLP